MLDDGFDRRGLLAAGGTIMALAAASGAAAAPATPAATAPGYAPKPLPFDPKSVGWLSEALITSHHDNNYTGAVKRLGQIRAAFASLDPAAAPGFQINGLKREELIAWNSMILHELYFGGFGPPSAPGQGLARAIERDFGSHDRWAAEFTAMGKALGGGSGWVVLTWSHRDRQLTNQWAADHSMTLAAATPLLVLDMYEHAYAMDFGARAAAYVDGFMTSLSWTQADALFARTAGTV